MALTREAEIAENLFNVRTRIATAAQSAGRKLDEISLIVVTKTFPVSDIQILKALGVNDFGENRDNDACSKAAVIKSRWHFQGQIQSNKLKSICSWAQVIHSLDDIGHFEIIQRVATHPLEIFLQVNLDGSHNRGGVSIESLYPLAEQVEADSRHTLAGLMAVAPLDSDPQIVFSELHEMHSTFCLDFPSATKLSAGMSGDFETAIAHGATHLRIGGQIMGSRQAGR